MPVKDDWADGPSGPDSVVTAAAMNAVATLLNSIESEVADFAAISYVDTQDAAAEAAAVATANAYTDAQIDDLIGGAPGLRDTLKELSDALDADESALAAVVINVNSRALDSAVVHNSGNETVAGVKTFSSPPVSSNPATTPNQLVRKTEMDSTTVHQTGNETIAGTKTFSSPPVIPDAVGSTSPVSKGQLDSAIAGVGGGTPGPNSITTAMLQTNSVTSDRILDGAVDSAELATGAVTNGKIGALAVDASKIANDTITATQIAPNAITASELADNAVDSGAIATDAVTKVKLANAAVGGNELETTGTMSGTTFLRGDMSWQVPPGGADARFVVYEFDFGDSRAVGTEYTITHNMGTKSMMIAFARNDSDWEQIGAVRVTKPTLNTIKIWPDMVISTNQVHGVLIGVVGSSDITGPAAGTMTPGTATASTIPVTVSGFTDTGGSGIIGYNWYRGGVYQGSTGAAAYTFTGLLPSTSYSLQAEAYDTQGNVGPKSTAITPSTSAGPPVASGAVGAYAQAAASTFFTSVATSLVVAADDTIAVVVAETSHVNGINMPAGFTSLTCTSNLGDTFTLLDTAVVNNASTGHVLVYYKLNPTVGTHTVTFAANSTASGQWQDFARIGAKAYKNVASIVARVKRTGQASAATLSAAITSAVNNMCGIAVGSDGAAVTSLTGATSRAAGGASANGTADFLLLADAPGATTVNVTGANSITHGYVSFDLVKA